MSSKKKTASLPAGIYPFWFWNGDIEESEIKWQIAQMSEQGVKGFFIHSRQGLKKPYLSETFMKLLRVAVETAREYGMSANLYDEYPYPSGTAAGEVVQENPAYMATGLSRQTFNVSGGPLKISFPAGKVLCCKAYPVTPSGIDWEKGIELLPAIGTVLSEESFNIAGLTSYTKKRYFASEPVPVLDAFLPQGEFRIVAGTQVLVKGHKYWDYFVDVLNEKAIARFIELTHGRYRNYFKEDFGKAITAIFTDETSPDRWSPLLFQAYEEKYGKKLLEALPAFIDPEHPEHYAVSHKIHDLKYSMFCQAFEGPVQKWCDDNNLKYVGEKNYMRLSQMKYLDIPGFDGGHTRSGAMPDYRSYKLRKNARAIVSAAHFYEKEGALCECYHSLGWGATLQDLRIIVDGLLLTGIKYIVPHAFFYTTHALAKHDAPPSMFFQMPYWKHFHLLSDRINRIWEVFENSYIDAKILIIDPSGGMPAKGQSENYQQLMENLSSSHYDYLIADTDILAEAKVCNGKIHIKNTVAEVIVLPEMMIVENELEKQIQRLVADGGCVINMAEDHVDDTIAAIKNKIKPSLHLEIIDGDGSGLTCVCRVGVDGRIWFLLNTSRNSCTVSLDLPETAGEIALDDNAEPQLKKSKGTLIRNISPFEAVLFKENAGCSESLGEKITITIPNKMSYKILNENVCRLGKWELSILDSDGNVKDQAHVDAMPVANQLAQGHLSFCPEFKEGFGVVPEWRQSDLSLRYRSSFTLDYNGPVNLIIEPDSIRKDWHIVINNKSTLKAEDFVETNTHIRGSLGVEITSMLVAGENTIDIFVKVNNSDDGLLNPVYLSGNFGVNLDPLKLQNLPDEIYFQSWKKNKLPFFAGVIEHNFEFVLDKLPEGKTVEVDLNFPGIFEDSCEVSINDGQCKISPWSPYRFKLSTEEFKEGINKVKLKVFTSLLQSFEGQKWDADKHSTSSIES